VPPEHTYLDALLLKLIANIDSCEDKKQHEAMHEVTQKEKKKVTNCLTASAKIMTYKDYQRGN